MSDVRDQELEPKAGVAWAGRTAKDREEEGRARRCESTLSRTWARLNDGRQGSKACRARRRGTSESGRVGASRPFQSWEFANEGQHRCPARMAKIPTLGSGGGHKVMRIGSSITDGAERAQPADSEQMRHTRGQS